MIRDLMSKRIKKLLTQEKLNNVFYKFLIRYIAFADYVPRNIFEEFRSKQKGGIV
jgi:hypothetical protein